MIGRISYEREKGRLDWRVTPVDLLAIGNITLHEPDGLPRWRLKRQIKKIERIFLKNGVRRIMLPDNFPYTERFSSWKKIDPLPFYRSIADLLVLASLKNKNVDFEKAVVSLCAPRLCPELRQTAERLCPAVRGLAIDVPEEGERYAVWLHRQYGIPIRAAGWADVTVLFGPGTPGENTLISLYEENVSLAGLKVTAPELNLPEECQDQLLAALWECGSLERKSLKVAMENVNSKCEKI